MRMGGPSMRARQYLSTKQGSNPIEYCGNSYGIDSDIPANLPALATPKTLLGYPLVLLMHLCTVAHIQAF